jgi:glycosyltransferase involved in cell wall biosynthesis
MKNQHSPVKLSVVTATYNRREFLPRCIDSVAAQSYPNKEHIIIDGGSTDGTVALLESLAGKYPHLRWISEKDNGISSALNKGFALATGDAIGVIGDDDFYAPEIFAVIAAEFAAYPDAGLVSGNCEFIDNENRVTNIQRASYTSRKELIQCWRFWGKRVAIAAPSTFISKRVIDEVGGFDEADRYAMDYHHWLKITEKFSDVRTVDQVFARFRLDSGTVSFSSNSEQWKEMLRISRKFWGSKGSKEYYENLLSFMRYYQLPGLRDRILSTASTIKRKALPRD